MKQDFTQNQLIQLIYGDTENINLVAAVRAISNNYSLREEMEELEEAQNALPDLTLSPSQSTIDSILQISRQNKRRRRDSSSSPLCV